MATLADCGISYDRIEVMSHSDSSGVLARVGTKKRNCASQRCFTNADCGSRSSLLLLRTAGRKDARDKSIIRPGLKKVRRA